MSLVWLRLGPSTLVGLHLGAHLAMPLLFR